jgi:hypothetical protein
MTVEQIQTKIIGEKSPDFKVMLADGAYTWFGSNGGIITFFYDTFEPEINEDGSLGVKIIKRTFPIEIRMAPETYKNVIAWMTDRVKIFEESVKAKKSN